MPGATVDEKVGDKIFLRNKCFSDPGDIHCSMWPLLGLAGIANKDWQPKFEYEADKKKEEAKPVE